MGRCRQLLQILDPAQLDTENRASVLALQCVALLGLDRVSDAKPACLSLEKMVISESRVSLLARLMLADAQWKLSTGEPGAAFQIATDLRNRALNYDAYETQFKASVMAMRAAGASGMDQNSAMYAQLARQSLDTLVSSWLPAIRNTYLARGDITADLFLTRRSK